MNGKHTSSKELKKESENINVKEDIKREPGQIPFNEALKKAVKPLKKK